jgi:hypothetical protein
MALDPKQQERLNQLAQEQNDRLKDGKNLTKEQREEYEELLALQKESLSTEEQRIKNLDNQIKQLNDQKELVEDLKEIGDSLIGIDELRLNNSIKLKELQKEEEELAKKKATLTREEYETELKLIAAKRTKLGVEEASQDAMGSLLKITTGMTEQSKLLGERLLNPMAGLTGAVDKLKTANPAMLLGAVASNSLQLAVAQDQAVTSFVKTTGAIDKFDDNIRGLERSLAMQGVSSAEASQSVQSLFLNVSDFTEMSEQEQRVLGENVAILNELGIASETAAKNIQFATKVLGQSVNEAVALQRELFVFAQDLGVSANQIAGDFQQMAPQIAAMGKNGVDAFKNLEAQSKSTGLAMTDLLGIVQKFDRFSTAADAVSGLNAILGGPFLNTVELVAETDLSKRFMMFRDAILATGKSFDQLEYFEKKALAAQIGINEAQLAMLMRGNMDQIIPEQKSADELVALQQQTAQFNTVMEELMQTMQALVVSFGPLVGMLKDVLNLVQFLGPVISQMIIPATLAWAHATGRLKLEMAQLLVGLVLMYQTFVFFTDVLGLSTPKAIFATVTALGVLAAAFYALGVSVNVALAGIPAILGLFSMLATGIMVGFSPSLYGAVMALGAAFLFLAPVMLPILGPIAAIVAGFAGMALVVTGLVGLLNSLGDGGLIDNFRIVAEEIANIVESINKLSEEKTVKFTTSMTAMAESFTGNVSSAAMQSVGNGAAMATVPAVANVPQQTSYNGPPPTFNVNVRIGDKDFATAVTDVELTGGINEKLSKSISDMMFSHFYK